MCCGEWVCQPCPLANTGSVRSSSTAPPSCTSWHYCQLSPEYRCQGTLDQSEIEIEREERERRRGEGDRERERERERERGREARGERGGRERGKGKIILIEGKYRTKITWLWHLKIEQTSTRPNYAMLHTKLSIIPTYKDSGLRG